MRHLIFLLPIAGVPLFWISSPGLALVINGVVWLVSILLFLVIRKTMNVSIVDGFNSLVGTSAEE